MVPSGAPGKRLHLRTVYRWRDEGKLEAVRIGGRWYTSREALARMAEPFTRPAAVVPGVTREDRARVARMNAGLAAVLGPGFRGA